jgi:hypothetical protein
MPASRSSDSRSVAQGGTRGRAAEARKHEPERGEALPDGWAGTRPWAQLQQIDAESRKAPTWFEVQLTHRWSKPDSNPRSHFSDPSFLIEISGSRETPKREIALVVEARDVLLKRPDLGPRLDDSDELYGILFGANF